MDNGGGGAPTGCYKCGRPGHWSSDCPNTNTNNNGGTTIAATPIGNYTTDKGTSGRSRAATGTGCYKCGRPGHWSRDCPDNNNNNNNNNDNNNINININAATSYRQRPPLPQQKQKTPRRTRPKLTPDLLLSNDGLGHILRFFPLNFKCRGRGREVSDLRHLLGMYAEWHSHLLPYYGFDQFVHKVEQVGATKRVKVCLRDLRDKVADGVDPAKLHEPLSQKTSSYEQDDQGIQVQENASVNEEMGNLQEDMPEDIWKKATEEETSLALHNAGIDAVAGVSGGKEAPLVQTLDNDAAGTSKQSQISDEQKARMEANRLKALERAAARSRSRQP